LIPYFKDKLIGKIIMTVSFISSVVINDVLTLLYRDEQNHFEFQNENGEGCKSKSCHSARKRE